MSEALKLLDLSLSRISLRKENEYKNFLNVLNNELIFIQNSKNSIDLQPSSPTLPFLSRQYSFTSIETLSKIAEQGSELITYLKTKNQKLQSAIKALQEKNKVLSNQILLKKSEFKDLKKNIQQESETLKLNEKAYELEINSLKNENLNMIQMKIEKITEIENEFNAKIKYEEENLQIANYQIIEIKEEIKKVEFETRMKLEKFETFENFRKDLEIKIQKCENEVQRKEKEMERLLDKVKIVRQSAEGLKCETESTNLAQPSDLEIKIRSMYEETHYTSEENQYLLKKLSEISQEY